VILFEEFVCLIYCTIVRAEDFFQKLRKKTVAQ